MRYLACLNDITSQAMKKSLALCLAAAIAMISNTSAQADWGHRHGGYRPPAYGHRHGGGGNWIGPAAVLAIAGLAIGATAYNRAYAAPAPVYTAPPPNPGMWYYCGSSGQYYPYTNICPEGWQAVPAR